MAKKKPPEEEVKRPPGPSKTVLDTGVRHQVYLERTATGLADQVKEALPEFQRLAIEWLGRQVELTSISHDEVLKLLESLREDQTQVLFDVLGTLSDQLAELSDYEAEFQAKFLDSMTVKDYEAQALEAGQAYEEALANPIAATGERLDGFCSGWAEDEAQMVGDLISKGYTQGWTNQDMVQAIRGTKAANYEDGLMPGLERDADVVVRTAVQHVANTARNATWVQNADVIQWVRVVATLDAHTTQQCRSLDGQRFRLGEQPQFPIHYGCRTTTVVEVAEEFAWMDEGATRASMDGPVKANQTYYEWLGGQPASFQDDALGQQRAQLFRDGGLSASEFARLNLGRNFQPLTLDEMRQKEPRAFERAGL